MLRKYDEFETDLARTTFYQKYALSQDDTWSERARTIVLDVAGDRGHGVGAILSKTERDQAFEYIRTFKLLPGGRYIYYAGRKARFWNNCYLLRAEEDTRQEWARFHGDAELCLMTGGGVGIDYSILRPSGRILSRTGGVSSGPIPAMHTTNEIGRNVMQGGSRRSALWAGLNWRHEDIPHFLTCKDWANMPVGSSGLSLAEVKAQDFNFPCPLDMTNISVLYDDNWLRREDRSEHPVFLENIRQALKNGEPGCAFNDADHANETLRNACTEVVSEDDGDVCNLFSVNIGKIESRQEMEDVCYIAAKLQICATIRGQVPYEKIQLVRTKNRRLGLGLMGVHAWMLQRNIPYGPNEELGEWLEAYVRGSERGANEHADYQGVSRPVAYRAIAPTGTIGIIASTTTGIEPLYATAYRRRYLTGAKDWKYKYYVDTTAQHMINLTGKDPNDIEDSVSLSQEPERRVAFQAWIQKYVDQGISSTINVPSYEEYGKDENRVKQFAEIIAKYAPKLRGITIYPDGARGGQPLTRVDYNDAIKYTDMTFEDNSEAACKGGVCGI